MNDEFRASHALIVLLLLSILACGGPQRAIASPIEYSLPRAPGEVLLLTPEGAYRDTAENAQRRGLLVVDLSDDWAPFILSEADGPGTKFKTNAYRKTFIELANDRVTPEEIFFESPAGRAATLAAVPPALRSSSARELSPELMNRSTKAVGPAGSAAVAGGWAQRGFAQRASFSLTPYLVSVLGIRYGVRARADPTSSP